MKSMLIIFALLTVAPIAKAACGPFDPPCGPFSPAPWTPAPTPPPPTPYGGNMPWLRK